MYLLQCVSAGSKCTLGLLLALTGMWPPAFHHTSYKQLHLLACPGANELACMNTKNKEILLEAGMHFDDRSSWRAGNAASEFRCHCSERRHENKVAVRDTLSCTADTTVTSTGPDSCPLMPPATGSALNDHDVDVNE